MRSNCHRHGCPSGVNRSLRFSFDSTYSRRRVSFGAGHFVAGGGYHLAMQGAKSEPAAAQSALRDDQSHVAVARTFKAQNAAHQRIFLPGRGLRQPGDASRAASACAARSPAFPRKTDRACQPPRHDTSPNCSAKSLPLGTTPGRTGRRSGSTGWEEEIDADCPDRRGPSCRGRR